MNTDIEKNTNKHTTIAQNDVIGLSSGILAKYNNQSPKSIDKFVYNAQ